jgi:circadian clock protein KaiC
MQPDAPMSAPQRHTPVAATARKAPTGLEGFDEITHGGLPAGRTTLLMGGPGSGKTILAMQFLAHGARACGEPGVLVAFEESPERLLANFEPFGWNLHELQPDRLQLLDARPPIDLIQSGSFDLSGMLASLGELSRRMGAKRIVFDALDIVLAMLPDAAARRHEIYRLNDWLLNHALTGVITAKTGGDALSSQGAQQFGFMQFMVDCAVILNHAVSDGVSQRNLRVQKYRGSGFDENESPFIIGRQGFVVAGVRPLGRDAQAATDERVSTGVERLDTMLGGGYFRGASMLITGRPGTAKSTLGGAFVEVACRRGERSLFVSFDSDRGEMVRNLGSVGIDLGQHIASGILQIVSVRTVSGSAETYLVRIRALAKEFGARNVVIDPVSTFFLSSNALTAQRISERLIDWSKSEGITLLCTSLVDETGSSSGGRTPLHISTLADTWIHLSYLLQSGERNRGLSIIKSRGTAHSNQVRELLLSGTGVSLADAYTSGGKVLMGTPRWEKERSERLDAENARIADTLKLTQLDAAEAQITLREKALQAERLANHAERTLVQQAGKRRQRTEARDDFDVRTLRSADASPDAAG